jgi:hypothetical protein
LDITPEFNLIYGKGFSIKGNFTIEGTIKDGNVQAVLTYNDNKMTLLGVYSADKH